MNPYLYNTGWNFDIVRLQADISEILERYPIPGSHLAYQGDIRNCNRISLVHEPGNPDPVYAGRQLFDYVNACEVNPRESESNFTEFNAEFKHMYVYEVYKELQDRLNNTLGRARIIRMKPRQQYPWHTDDATLRYHIAIETNPECSLYIQKSYYQQHIPANGDVWILDTAALHRADNLGVTVRDHLVFGQKVRS